jgi:hypothetical protein
MGFFSNLFSAAVKTAITPAAILKDVVNVATDNEPYVTKNLLESAGDDLSDAIDDITGK